MYLVLLYNQTRTKQQKGKGIRDRVEIKEDLLQFTGITHKNIGAHGGEFPT